MINKYSTVPLYSQLKQLIIEKIENGEYTENSKIPSEQDLCEMYDISRPTVRQAITEMTNNGYLYKEKGKGTFVAKNKKIIDVKNYSGFTDSILDSENTRDRIIISTEALSNSDKKLCEVFNLLPSQKSEFARISYLTRNKEDILSYNVSYMPLYLFPSIIDDIIEKKSSDDILKGKYPLVPNKSRSSLEITYTDQEDAKYLQVQQCQALIKIDSVLFSKNRQPVEYIIAKYRADKCRLIFENCKV